MGTTVVIKNVLTMLFYLFCGWGLVRADLAESDHARSVSGLLIYVCGPAMILNAFRTMKYSPENVLRLVEFFFVSLAVQVLFFLILWAVFHRKYSDSRYRILSVGSMLGNVGFFGLPLVVSLFPDSDIVACYSVMYITSMNILIFTLGTYMITKNRRFISLKSALLNPTMIGVAAALPLFLLQFEYPAALSAPLSLLGSMTAPLCMVILGMRLASMSFRELFCQPFAYAVCALKLVVFPLFAYLCAVLVPGTDGVFRTSMLVLSAVPSASMLLSMAELHRCERELAANAVLLTTLACSVTLPIIMWVVSR